MSVIVYFLDFLHDLCVCAFFGPFFCISFCNVVVNAQKEAKKTKIIKNKNKKYAKKENHVKNIKGLDL